MFLRTSTFLEKSSEAQQYFKPDVLFSMMLTTTTDSYRRQSLSQWQKFHAHSKFTSGLVVYRVQWKASIRDSDRNRK